jgi:hypothetical protein
VRIRGPHKPHRFLLVLERAQDVRQDWLPVLAEAAAVLFLRAIHGQDSWQERAEDRRPAWTLKRLCFSSVCVKIACLAQTLDLDTKRWILTLNACF